MKKRAKSTEVIKPGTNDQPGGTYIEVQRSGSRVQGGRVIEIEQGGHCHQRRILAGDG